MDQMLPGGQYLAVSCLLAAEFSVLVDGLQLIDFTLLVGYFLLPHRFLQVDDCYFVDCCRFR